MDLAEVNDDIYKVDITWPAFDVSAQEALVNEPLRVNYGQLLVGLVALT